MKGMFCVAVTVIALGACAPMMPAPVSQIESLQVVKMGDVPPSGSEYVLHIPANSPIPVNVHARGTLLKQGQSAVGSLSFTKDVYVYKYWASHDRKNWQNSHSLLDVSFNGGFDVSGMNVNVQVDKKQ